MRIVFAGTPDFAVPALSALADAGHELVAIYTQPDRPAGRGRKLTPSPVKQRALELGLPVEQPASLRDAGAVKTLAEYRPEVMVVVAYGLILPADVLSIPARGCLNIHASILPRWRGAAPIQRAIEAGDDETGVAIMQMDEGLDTGAVLLEKRCLIEAGDTGQSLHDRLSTLGADAIVEALERLDSLAALPQDADGVTYAKKLDKAEAIIDWSESAEQIARRVRAFNSWPVAQTAFAGDTLRIWLAEALAEAATAEPGTLLRAGKQGIDVATGDGVLRITRLQAPGRKPVAADAFANSHQTELAVGQKVFG
ncbi:MAG: methionyl-tRNA formyltransferase [Gammaproteobacteria bacterium]|nr:methionyl-tRNA formyltransferase [Gammaproteobacteria bacterium]